MLGALRYVVFTDRLSIAAGVGSVERPTKSRARWRNTSSMGSNTPLLHHAQKSF